MSSYSNQGSSRGTGRSTSGRSSAARTGGRRTASASRSTSGRSSASSRSTAARSAASVRSSSAGRSSAHHVRRRRRNSLDFTKILLGIIGVLVLILCVSLAARGCGKRKGGNETESAEALGTEAVAEKVTVDGVDISGRTQEQAKAAILAQYNWNMKVTYQDKEAEVGNLMEAKVTELLDEIYAGEIKVGESYTVNMDNMMEPAMAEAALIAGNWNMVAKNGGISGYDKSSGTFTFSEGTNGMVIDQEHLAQAIVDAIQAREYDKTNEASVKEVSPELTAAQLKDKYKTIATYTTTTTSNSNRNENIRLACEAVNGTILNPGQEFSFNETTGARTEAKGYKPATAYLNGEVVQEPGGGVCQVSSTLYNAVVFAGLKSTERHAHSYEPSYVTPGEEAAVSYGGPDFKFVNNSDYPIAIKTSFANRELTISIYGVQILPDGTKIRMESKKTSELDPPEPTYEEDQTLQPEVEKVVKEAVMGTRWTTELEKYENGTVVSREHFHSSTYRGKAAIIKRNTSGVVATTADPSAESGESVPEGENGQAAEGGPGSLTPGGESDSDGSGETVPENNGGSENSTGQSAVSPSGDGDAAGRSDGTADAPGGEAPTEQAPVVTTPGGSSAPGAPVQANPIISEGPGGSPAN